MPRAGAGAPTDRPDRIARALVDAGASVIHLVDLDGARAGQPEALGSIAEVSRAVAVPLQVAGGVDGPEQIELCFAAGATRVVVPLWAVIEDPERLAACLAIAGDWLGIGLDARPERLREYPWKRYIPPTTLEQVVTELGDGRGPPVRAVAWWRIARPRARCGAAAGARRRGRRGGRVCPTWPRSDGSRTSGVDARDRGRGAVHGRRPAWSQQQPRGRALREPDRNAACNRSRPLAVLRKVNRARIREGLSREHALG